MTQNVAGFAEFQAKRRLKERRYLEKMKKRGHTLSIALNILIWLAAYAIVRVLHVLCFRLGWLHSPGSNSIGLIFCAILTGASVGEREWYNMKRKLSLLQPDDDLTAK
jgi:hypothetical protein